jgi:osmotically-inducible protein OsmY
MKTDQQTQQDVLDELRWDPAVNAAQIGVTVKEGAVTLTGEVDSYASKWAAEQAALRVAGVKDLAVELEVQLSGVSERKDDDIARAAESALKWNEFVPSDKIKIMVEKGWLTLSGEVDWGYQRQWATDCVSNLRGVTGVTNNIVLKQRAVPNDIKANIEAALRRVARSDAQTMSVDVNGGQVTVEGPVHSWAERDTITHAVWSAPGVTKVVDHTYVTY